ncbi:helix-turn-helix transcriptional regulator [Bacillus sp. AFS088145]|uniref:helix-turn-helix domain-containing protein n=1 Tax=Bacillus sp. AFS088145 TaxID=2033514 RepID=UPI000BF9BE39|nr:helix-turn-helix transcriptional regulator [Bacillus sp. AFS088145]PFH92638.1 transcriptional regulator [Bacillus sp. AFS088145]
MTEFLNLVGTKVRYFRKLNGLTQEELAEKADVHYTYIGGIERGERNISLETLEKICIALNVSPSLIFHQDSLSFSANDLDRGWLLKLHIELLESRSTKEIMLIHETVQRIVNFIDNK